MPNVQVNYDPQEPTLRPAQSVLPVPYVPPLPAAAAFPFEQLAGLSTTLTKISLQQKERENQAELEIGRKLGNDAGDDQIDQLALAHKQLGDAEYQKQLNQAAFLQAEKSGKIQPAQNEWRAVGYTESASRRIMARYESDLIAAQSQATATMDKDGQPVPAKPVEQVIQETWNKYKDNAFFQDYYGAKTANGLKASIDTRYRSDVANKLAANMAEDYQVNTANEVARWATTKFQKGEVTPEDLANVSAILNQHRLQGVDVPKALLEGITNAAANADSADEGDGLSHAAKLIHLAMNVPVGTTTAGEDARLGPRLKALAEHYDQSQYEKKRLKIANMDADTALRHKAAEKDMDEHVQAMRAIMQGLGFTPAAQSAEMDRYINDGLQSNKWGAYTRETGDYLRKVQESTLVLDSNANFEQVMHALDVGKDSKAAQTMLDGYVQSRQMSYGDIQKARAAFEAHDKTSDLLTSDSTRRAEVQVRSAAKVDGVTPGADELVQRDMEDALAQLGNDRAKFARSLAGKSPTDRADAMDQWNEVHAKQLVQDTREKVDAFRKTRDMAQTEIEGQLKSWHAIDRNLLDVAHGIAPAEKQDYLRREDVALERRKNLFNDSAYNKFEASMVQDGLLAASKKDLVPEDAGAAQLAIRADLRQRAEAMLDNITANAKDPSTIPTEFEKGLLDLGIDWHKENLGGHFGTWQKTLRPAQPGEAKQLLGETSEVIRKDVDNQAAALRLQSISESKPGDYAIALVSATDPLVSKDAYDVIKGAYGNKAHLAGLGAPYTLNEAEMRAFTESQGILAKTGVTDAAKAKAVLTMYGPVGIPAEDLLQGKLVVRTPAFIQKGLQDVADAYKGAADTLPLSATRVHLEQQAFFGGSKFYSAWSQRMGDVRGRLAEIQAEQPKEIPVKAGDINPYTTPMFKDNAELLLWTKTRGADFRALASKYGVGDSDQDLKAFFDAQRDLNNRRENLAR